jgi:hypothetical protein
MPAGWLSNRELAAAAGVFLAANVAGCGGKTPATSDGSATPGAALVAPVFTYGMGVGESPRQRLSATLGIHWGGVTAYLSEEDAITIITWELARAGVQASVRNVPLDDVIIRGRELRMGYDWLAGRNGLYFADNAGPLVADLADPQRRIFVEFISKDEFFTLGGMEDVYYQVNYRALAQDVAARVRQDGKGLIFAAFYDPIEKDNDSLDECWQNRDNEGPSNAPPGYAPDRPTEAEKRARFNSQQLLHQQVRDFVDWLRAQGVV